MSRLSERQVSLLVSAAIIIGGLLLYIPLAGTYGLWDPWETHYSEVARQMTKRGDFISLWWPGSPRDPNVGDPLVTFRYDQAWEFVDAIRNQRPCVPSFHDGARVQAVTDAAVRSSETRQWVEL